MPVKSFRPLNPSSRGALYPPLLLYAGVNALAQGAQQGLQQTNELRNPYQTAMLVDEIRLYSAVTPDQQLTNSPVLMNDIPKFRLKLGSQELTDEFVPQYLFGPTLDWFSFISAITPSGYGVTIWRLPKPLYVPRNGFINATFANDAAFWQAAIAGRTLESFTVDFGIALAARSLPSDYPVPEYVDVPYVSKFLSEDFSSAVPIQFQSSETDLKNPFQEELQVDQFIYMVEQGIYKAEQSGYTTLRPVMDPTQGELPDVLARILTMKIYTYSGAVVQRDPIPLGVIASPAHRSWPLKTALPPKGYVTCYVNADPVAATTNSFRLCASIVGHRRVALANLGVAP